MADTSISNLSAGAAVSATDVFPNVQTAGVGPVKTTAAQIKTFTSASPTLVTPTLGVATATSINKVALTAPATGSTLTIADGKTLTANASITLAGTDSTTMTFPSSSTTVAGLSIANSFTTSQNVTPSSDVISLALRRNGAAQTANILEIQTEANAFLSGFDKSGILTLGAASTQTGTLKLVGTTSGTVTLSVADAAGTYTLKLPTTDGNASEFLQTDGSGNLTWAAGGGGVTIDSTAITSGTAGRLLFESATNKVTESASLSWDDTNKILTLGVSGTSSGILKLANSTAAAFVQLTPTANATLQLGAADDTAPVAQKLQVQSVVAGTTDTAGAAFTIAGSKGTGMGAGGSIIFQVAPAAGSTGTSQNALATALTIDSTKLATFAGDINMPATFSIKANGTTKLDFGVSSANTWATGSQILAYGFSATSGDFKTSAAGFVYWVGRTQMKSPADKVLVVEDSAAGAAIIQTKQFTVANLPSAASYAGALAFVSDANATTPRSTVAGGGSNKVMVMSDGTNWLIVA